MRIESANSHAASPFLKPSRGEPASENQASFAQILIAARSNPMRTIAAAAAAATAAATATAASASAALGISAGATSLPPSARMFGVQYASGVSSVGGAMADFDTDRGTMSLDIDRYFTPAADANRSGGDLPPLLMPSPGNIEALTKHIAAKMPGFLARHDIPFPPSSVSYDDAGQIQLPADYPYASAFKLALEGNPTMARELGAVTALTSSWNEMRKSIPFQQEYGEARTAAQIKAVIEKYSYLFSDARHSDAIAMRFGADGSLSLTANGKRIG